MSKKNFMNDISPAAAYFSIQKEFSEITLMCDYSISVLSDMQLAVNHSGNVFL